MPTYTYSCPDCGAEDTIIHAITVDPAITCSFCEGTMQRKPQVNAVTFDGSGWGKDA